MVAPVAGLRPWRAALSFTLNLPNPLSAISSPPAAALAMAANTASTILRASALVRSWPLAIVSARSALFTEDVPSLRSSRVLLPNRAGQNSAGYGIAVNAQAPHRDGEQVVAGKEVSDRVDT